MHLKHLGFIVTAMFTAVLYNNCSATHQGNASLSSFEACNLILKDEFANGYHVFLQNNCIGCHTTNGTGNGAFADVNLDAAFDAFLIRGNKLVGNRAKDSNHQPPFTGPQHDSEISEFDSTWNASKQQADQCVASSGGAITENQEDGIIPETTKPTEGTITTHIKLIEADKDGKTITWDLGSEFKTENIQFPNAELSIKVSAITTINGDKSYIISEPKLKAGDVSLHIVYIDFIINNKLIEQATSYQSIERRVAAGDTRDLAGGSTTFIYNVQATDSIALSIGTLDSITFDPPTFAELIDTNGVLGENCLNCHSGASPRGGFDITSREQVISQLMVAPYSPNNSEIFKRMNNTSNPMPTSGLLPQADIDQVLHWIQDGAP